MLLQLRPRQSCYSRQPFDMSKIFISYRRADSADATGRLADRLRRHFGDDAVFLDIDDDRKGHDFNEYIQQEIATAQVVLVVIGRGWIGESDEGRRIDNEKDNVRIEVEHALATGRPVIPVLVDGAIMPSRDALPSSIAGLNARAGIELTAGSGFEGQAEYLYRAIRRELSLWRNIMLGRAGWRAYTAISVVISLILALGLHVLLGVRSSMDDMTISCSSHVVLLCAGPDQGVIPFNKLPVQATLEPRKGSRVITLIPWPEAPSATTLQKFDPKTCREVEGEIKCLTVPLRPDDYIVRMKLEGILGNIWTQDDQNPLSCRVEHESGTPENATCK